MMKYLIFIPLFLFTSCGSYRIFQDKVPEPIKKNTKHIENEKQGAFYLATYADNKNKSLADALSRSLGIPLKVNNDSEEITNGLHSSTSKFENRILGLNTELENLQGKDIEGTGVNFFPITSIIGIIVIIGLLILFPSALTVLFFVLRRTRTAFANVVSGVKEFTENNPNESKGLEELLDKKLDMNL